MRFPGQVRNKNIFVPVIIKIGRCDSHSRFRFSVPVVSGAGNQGALLEGSIALVDPKLIGGFVVRDEYVDPPVSIEICAYNAQSVRKRRADSSLVAHIELGLRPREKVLYR